MQTTSTYALLLSLALLGGQCFETEPQAIDEADDALLSQRTAYERMDAAHQLVLAPPTEAGQRLLVLGRLVSKESGLPLAGRSIIFYQANHAGSYDESVPGDETTARLNGTVRTDSLGRFFLSTILPGDYGSTAGNRHIHTTVAGARPEGYDFFFRPYINRGLLSWARRSDQGIVLVLKQAPGDTLLAAADLVVKGFQEDGVP